MIDICIYSAKSSHEVVEIREANYEQWYSSELPPREFRVLYHIDVRDPIYQEV